MISSPEGISYGMVCVAPKYPSNDPDIIDRMSMVSWVFGWLLPRRVCEMVGLVLLRNMHQMIETSLTV